MLIGEAVGTLGSECLGEKCGGGWVVERVDVAASSIVVVVGYASPNKEQGNACNTLACVYTL